jgi:hypothetical protein
LADKTDEKKLKERFTQDLTTATQYMNPIHQLMDKYYEIYRNRWNEDESRFQISDLYAYVETVVPILTNSRVRASVHSDYPDYVTNAAGMTDILDNIYDINNWDYESQEIARTAEIYRSAIAYTGWDGDYKNGTGKVCVKGVNIRWCYLDPAPSKFEDSSFFFYVEPKRKTAVIKEYPEKKKEIEASIGKRDNERDNNKSGRWFKTFVNRMKQFVTFNTETNAANMLRDYQTYPELTEEEKRKNAVAFIHYWYRDDDDKWRVSYWADDVFLSDEENPFWHDKLPYDIYNPTKDILSSMGVPMAEHIENLNHEKNTMMQYIIDNARLHADPPMVHNTAMGNIQDPRSLNEQYSKNGVIQINNPDMVPLNAMVDYMQPPTMPGYAIDLPDRYGVLEDRLTGVNDSFRGMADATSGKEVQLKQEAAYTRIKTKIDNFELFNKSIAEKLIVLAMQYYKETRAFRIKGDASRYDQMAQMGELPFEIQGIPKGVGPDGAPIMDKSEFYLYANPNEWTKIVEQPQEPQMGPDGQPVQTQEPEGEPTKEDAQEAYKILQFTVEIEAGSSLPQSRLARREEAIELATAGFIDQQSVLDVYDWPDREEIIKRMAEAAQAQQEAQMQAEMAKQEQAMQMKQMELQARSQEQQMNNEAKMQQTQMNNEAKAQGQPQQPDLASQLDQLREADPRLQALSDEELMALLAQQPA